MPWIWAFAGGKRLMKDGVTFVVKISGHFRTSFAGKETQQSFTRNFTTFSLETSTRSFRRKLHSSTSVRNGPNTFSGSTVSNTELSEFFCPHRVPGRELSEFLSAYYLCAKASFRQNSPSLPQNSVSSLFRNSTLETVFRPFPILQALQGGHQRSHSIIRTPPICTAVRLLFICALIRLLFVPQHASHHSHRHYFCEKMPVVGGSRKFLKDFKLQRFEIAERQRNCKPESLSNCEVGSISRLNLQWFESLRVQITSTLDWIG